MMSDAPGFYSRVAKKFARKAIKGVMPHGIVEVWKKARLEERQKILAQEREREREAWRRQFRAIA